MTGLLSLGIGGSRQTCKRVHAVAARVILEGALVADRSRERDVDAAIAPLGDVLDPVQRAGARVGAHPVGLASFTAPAAPRAGRKKGHTPHPAHWMNTAPASLCCASHVPTRRVPGGAAALHIAAHQDGEPASSSPASGPPWECPEHGTSTFQLHTSPLHDVVCWSCASQTAGFTVNPAVMKPPEHPPPGMEAPLDDPELLLDAPASPPGRDGLLVSPPHPANAAPSVRATTVVPMFTRASFASATSRSHARGLSTNRRARVQGVSVTLCQG